MAAGARGSSRRESLGTELLKIQCRRDGSDRNIPNGATRPITRLCINHGARYTFFILFAKLESSAGDAIIRQSPRLLDFCFHLLTSHLYVQGAQAPQQQTRSQRQQIEEESAPIESGADTEEDSLVDESSEDSEQGA